MKIRLMAIPVLAIGAGLLSHCTQDYTDGHTVSDDRTLRPGETPIGTGEKVAESDTPSPTAAAGADMTAWRIDADAPKQSNGGSGGELERPASQPAR